MMLINCGVGEEALVTWTKEQWEKIWENQRQRNIEKRIELREAKKMKEVAAGHVDKVILVAGQTGNEGGVSAAENDGVEELPI